MIFQCFLFMCFTLQWSFSALIPETQDMREHVFSKIAKVWHQFIKAFLHDRLSSVLPAKANNGLLFIFDFFERRALDFGGFHLHHGGTVVWEFVNVFCDRFGERQFMWWNFCFFPNRFANSNCFQLDVCILLCFCSFRCDKERHLTASYGALLATKPLGVLPLKNNFETVAYKKPWQERTFSKAQQCHKNQIHSIPSVFYSRCLHIQYVFILSEYLKLNLTISDMNISPTSLDCREGYIAVKETTKQNTATMRYCGIHSKILVYISGQTIVIAFESDSYIIAHYAMTYSVFDQKTLRSMPHLFHVWNKNIQYYVKEKVFFSTIQMQRTVYNVLSRHNERIVFKEVKRGSHSSLFFDGPGHRSPPVHHVNKSVHVSSTFQVTIYHYQNKTSADTLLWSEHTLSFICQKRKVDTTLFVNNRTQAFHFSSTQSHFPGVTAYLTAAQFVTSDSVVKLSLVSVHYIGDVNTQECSFAGLAIYETGQNKLKFIKTECVKDMYAKREKRACQNNIPDQEDYHIAYDVEIFKHTYPEVHGKRTTYFNSSSVLLVWYSYPNYGELNISVTIEGTKCKLLTLKYCNDAVNKLQWNLPCAVIQFESSRAAACKTYVMVHKYKKRDKVMNLRGSGVLRGKLVNCPSLSFVVSQKNSPRNSGVHCQKWLWPRSIFFCEPCLCTAMPSFNKKLHFFPSCNENVNIFFLI